MNLELAAVTDAENPIAGDLKLTNGQLSLVDGTEAIAQHLRNRLRFFLGEWFLDQRQGLPFFREIFVKNPDRQVIRTIFRRTIRETPGIATMARFELTIDTTRSARLTFVALLDEPGADPLEFSDFILGEF